MGKKQFFQNVALMAASIVFICLLLEALLRFFPVREGLNFVPVNAEQPIFHALPDRTITISKDWDFYNARKIEINNAGFRNDQDYTTQGSHPLIAIIGDSYIQAVQVDYKDTLYSQLDQKLDEDARVYSFGFSGAPLSQYLAWAQYATQTFKAGYLTFVIISNDFDESLSWRKPNRGLHLYERCEERVYCLERQDYQIGPFRPIVEASALLRYLVYNLQIMEFVSKIKLKIAILHKNNGEETFIGNVKAEVGPELLEESKIAVDSFFRDLPSYTGLSPHKINFVIDGRFYEEDDTRFEESYFGEMRRYFMKQATEKNYSVIDMKPIFWSHFQKHGERFDFPRDAHWNELGHTLTADSLHKLYRPLLY